MVPTPPSWPRGHAIIVGFQGTSNVLAGRLFDIPLYGTMAHSFIQAHDDEAEAFENFADANSGDIVLLIDTYDTEAAAEKVTHLAAAWKERGIKIKGVRIDSGDLGSEAERCARSSTRRNFAT